MCCCDIYRGREQKVMNKIQKVLWSIFSGLICIIYKSDYYAHAASSGNELWAVTSWCHCSTTNSCTDNCKNCARTQDYELIISKNTSFNFNANYITDSIIYITTPKTTSITHIAEINTSQGGSDTLCGRGYYYKCDSTTLAMSGCCEKCPTPIAGTDDIEVFYKYTRYDIRPQINGSKYTSEGGLYVNICSEHDILGNPLGGVYMQVYKSQPLHRADKDIAASGCKLTIVELTNNNSNNEYTDGEHSDNTGTYEYTQGDECSYEKQD